MGELTWKRLLSMGLALVVSGSLMVLPLSQDAQASIEDNIEHSDDSPVATQNQELPEVDTEDSQPAELDEVIQPAEVDEVPEDDFGSANILPVLAPDKTELWGKGGNTLDTFDKCGPNTIFLMVGEGLVQEVCNGEVINSYDIPHDKLSWAFRRNESGRIYWERSQSAGISNRLGHFNGLATYSANGDPGMWALETGSVNDTSDYDGNVLLWHWRAADNTPNEGYWHAVDGRKGEIKAEWVPHKKHGGSYVTPTAVSEIQGGYIFPSVAGTDIKSYPNTNSTDTNPERAYTISGAGTAFLVGAMAPDGSYIFGGPRPSKGVAKHPEGGNELKLFARKPDGTIVYFGHVDMPVLPELKDRAVFKDVEIQFDDLGNMLVQYGQRQGSASGSAIGPETHKYLRTVSKDDFQDALNNPLAKWDPSKNSRGEWVSTGVVGPVAGRSFKLSSGDNIFKNNSRVIQSDPVFQGLRINIPGTNPSAESSILNKDGSLLMASYFSDGLNPSNQISRGKVYRVSPVTGDILKPNPVYETDNVGHRKPSATVYYYPDEGGLKQYPGGGRWGYQFVELEGSPSSTPPKVKVAKQLVSHVNPNDQFDITVQVDWGSGNQTSTTGSTNLQPGDTQNDVASALIGWDSKIKITESMKTGSVSDLAKYKTSLQCTFTDPTGLKQTKTYPLSQQISVPRWSRGDVECTVTNAAKELPVLKCGAGDMYSITEKGQLRYVDQNGNVSSVGQRPDFDYVSWVNMFNALGVTPDGKTAYAIENYNPSPYFSSQFRVWKYDAKTGEWIYTGAQWDTRVNGVNGTGVGAVAGAVNPKTGRYVIGGFTEDEGFRLWEYNPKNKQILYKGVVETGAKEQNANGDIAFDAEGNLIIIRGVAKKVTSFSVTANNFAAAAGGTIPFSQTEVFTQGLNNVNGVAFDSTGKVYISDETTLNSYNSPSWDNEKQITYALSLIYPNGESTGASTDLSSCSYPPTVTVQKNIDGGRVKDADQFTIELKQDNTRIAKATTAGNNSGVQKQQIGPFPMVPGHSFVISESAGNGGTSLDDYETSYQCTADGNETPFVAGEGTEGRVDVYDNVKKIECTIINKPAGSLRFEKVGVTDIDTSDIQGADHLSGSEWKLQLMSASGQPAKTWIISDWVADEGTPVPEPKDGELSDIDSRPGYFSINGLTAGNYRLQETKAPVGYSLRGAIRSFEISHQNLVASFEGNHAIPNEQMTPPSLPRTGGIGRDAFLIFAALSFVAALTTITLLGRKHDQNK